MSKQMVKNINIKEYPKPIKLNVPDTRILISYKLKQS